MRQFNLDTPRTRRSSPAKPDKEEEAVIEQQ
jgi:hypothetical protein